MLLAWSAFLMYFIRSIALASFKNQSSAETSRNTVIQIFDNIPDAVILVTEKTKPQLPEIVSSHMEILQDTQIRIGDVGAIHFDLKYCNKQSDEFFDSTLSKAHKTKEQDQIFADNQHLLLQKRCLHRIKGISDEFVAR